MERFAKVNELLAEYESLEAQMADPSIHSDQTKHGPSVKDMPNSVQLLLDTVPTKQLKKILLLAKSLLKQIQHLPLK